MKKLAIIFSSAVLFSQGAFAEPTDVRGGVEREQHKLDRELKIERDKKNHYSRMSREEKYFK
ncbi:conserved exported hypothetical protein [uncultured Thiomicrorhabdus sp.]